MSCYEWERGTIKLSVKEYARIKKAFLVIIKENQERLYQNAVKLYDNMMRELKGKRSVDVHSVYCSCQCVTIRQYETIHLDEDSIFYRKSLNHEDKTKRPLKPKKKDYFTKIDRKNVSVHFEDASISFRDSDRTIYWSVSENNHSRERAHDHPTAKALFKLLKTVNWTRGTGGQIVGNDEYNRDADYEGGGANYVTMSFGPQNKNNYSALRYT